MENNAFMNTRTHQNSVGIITILAREGSVDSETDTVTHDGKQDKKVKWFPFDNCYAEFPQWVFERHAAHGLLSPVWGWLCPNPSGGFLLRCG